MNDVTKVKRLRCARLHEVEECRYRIDGNCMHACAEALDEDTKSCSADTPCSPMSVLPGFRPDRPAELTS